MRQYVDIEYKELEQSNHYDELINKVIAKCFEIEALENTELYVLGSCLYRDGADIQSECKGTLTCREWRGVCL